MVTKRTLVLLFTAYTLVALALGYSVQHHNQKMDEKARQERLAIEDNEAQINKNVRTIRALHAQICASFDVVRDTQLQVLKTLTNWIAFANEDRTQRGIPPLPASFREQLTARERAVRVGAKCKP
jgi:hypothetical protein